jgi:hypothetical protein
MKKIEISLTQKQVELLRYSLDRTIELDETFWVDGLTRDASASADYRGLKALESLFDKIGK